MRSLLKSCCASILGAALLLPCVVQAYTAYDAHDNKWTYQLCDDGCEIGGVAVYQADGDLEIPETLGGYDVVRIGYHAFFMCDYLTSLSIPKTVTSIDPYAFLGCTGLLSFEVDSRNNSYQASSDGFLLTKGGKTLVAVPGSFSSVTIPSGVTSIGHSAFSGCLVESIEIPAAVTNIGECAFAQCSELEDVVISAEGEDLVIGDLAFVGCPFYSVSIPSRVKGIGRYAFAEGPSAPVDPSVIVTPSMYAVYVSFGDTDRVKGLLTDSNHNIEDVTFVELDEYGNMYAEIDGYKWSCRLNDDGRTVSIMKKDQLDNYYPAVSPVPTGAVTIPNSLCGYPVVNIGRHALNFGSGSGITDVTIPFGVTNIGVCAFAWCSMTNITLSYSVRSIGDQAFQNCEHLVSVDIPDSVESIGETAFWECRSLSRVRLSLGMTSLAPYTFQQCSRLTRVTMPPNVTAISGNAFSDVNLGGLTICVLPGLVDAVKGVFRNSGYTDDQINSLTFEEGDGNGMYRQGDDIWYFRIIDGKAVLGRNLDNEDPSVDHVAVSPMPTGNIALPAEVSLKADLTDHIPVVGVGYQAFKACTALSQVNIQENVTNVNPYAFTGCTGLGSFAVGSQNEYYMSTAQGGLLLTKDGSTLVAFPGGNTSVTFPAGVTSIGASAFSVSRLTGEVQIPVTVTNIGECAFVGCMNLTDVAIPDSGADIYIGDEAFSMCRMLASARIPSRVKSIGDRAFTQTGLKTVYVSSGDAGRVRDMFLASKHDVDGITFIEPGGTMQIVADGYVWYYRIANGEAEIFRNDTRRAVSLMSGEKPTGEIEVPCALGGYPVTRIGNGAFYQCTELTGITIPDGVTSIGDDAFRYCYSLADICIPGSMTGIGDRAFHRCYALTNVTMASSVMTIGERTFYECTNLTSVTTLDGVTSIGEYAFSECSNLTGVTIPDSMNGIWTKAFMGCGLTEVAISDGVSNICNQAFALCTSLKSALIPTSVTNIEYGAFGGTGLEVVYVSAGDVERVKGMFLDSSLSEEFVNSITFVDGGPSINGDPDAVVTGDAIGGYEIVPSTTAGTVEVDIPEGIEADKVTVVLPPTASAKLNGAKMKVVKGEIDITAFLDIPAPNASGVTDLNAAVVKEGVVREVFDADKGANVKLDANNPSITTSPTHPGLTYTFSEGVSLEGLTQKFQKAGDGNPWTPEITVKGGRSGFYSIRVTK